ncbi:MAG: hypothetical protein NT136_01545 [Candidatus Moranbacteria bacterium]|nr:hypothetical protein [Candidatus Moranbacteria bacterium]
MLDVDQAGELKAAFRRGDWTNAEIKKLSEGDILAQVRQVILGYAEIKLIDHVINCDADPFVPSGWNVIRHKKGRQLKWDPTEISLYLSKKQRDRKVIEGNILHKELEKMPVLNANVLDYLLANPHLIPEEWKDKYVFFWGTIYRDSTGYLSVRYLDWHGGRWHWHGRWLDDDWSDFNPAALLAS